MEWRCRRNLPAQLPGSCRCSFRLLLCLETPCVLVMEIHTACQSADSAAGDAGSYYTYAGFLVMGDGNGDDGDGILLPGSRCGTSSWYYGSWGLASGNGQWRRISRTCCQGRWSCTMLTTQCSGGRLAMEPMEGATIPPKIYSKL
jgi:hypothetical protein